MRKLLLTTAAVAAAIAGAFADGPSFGTFTDTRDGKTYKTAVIGGKRWMAENLNYPPQSGRYWCYELNSSNCDKYGMLYDFHTARTVCPKGFHLPSRLEWDNLTAAAGGKNTAGEKLKSTDGWKEYGDITAADNYGFSALPGGARYIAGFFDNAGYSGIWWTATEHSSGIAYYRYMLHYNFNVGEDSYGAGNGFSVRCVAD